MKTLHRCNKCRHESLVELIEGIYGEYFRCPHCRKASPAWEVNQK